MRKEKDDEILEVKMTEHTTGILSTLGGWVDGGGLRLSLCRVCRVFLIVFSWCTVSLLQCDPENAFGWRGECELCGMMRGVWTCPCSFGEVFHSWQSDCS